MTSYIYDMVDTWNAGATTFTAVKMNVTDTASNAASLLMDLQVGGSSRLAVRKDGFVQLNGAGASLAASSAGVGTLGTGIFHAGADAGGLRIGASADVILSRRAAANLRLGAADAAAPVAQTLSVQSVVAGTTNTAGANLTITGSQGTGTGAGGSIVFQVAPAGSSGTAQNALADALTISSTRNLVVGGTSIQFGAVGSGTRLLTSGKALVVDSGNTNDFGSVTASSYILNSDVILARDAANTLALRNGANAQAFNLYNTYDGTNNERGFIRWSGNAFQVGTEKDNSGTERDFAFSSGAAGGQVQLTPNGIIYFNKRTVGTRWYIDANGHFIGGADNTYDIGASGATRPRNIYAGTSITGPHRMTGTAPASAVATGTAGDLRYDADYLYICTATDTWKRVAIATWP